MGRSPKYCYVKGEFVLEENASISIRDRGFRFGDGVFETILFKNNKIYNWAYNLKRLSGGLESLKIITDITSLYDICLSLICKNQQNEGFVRIAISRGEGSRGYLPDIKNGASVVIETISRPELPISPVSLSISDIKCINNGISGKTMQGLSSTLARMQAQEAGCFEALMLNHNGIICECSSSNIFWRKGDKLYTPSLNTGIVAGSIRDKILEICPFEIEVGSYSLKDISTADEIFITNVAWLALPVCKINDINVELKNFSVAEEIKNLLIKDIENYAAI